LGSKTTNKGVCPLEGEARALTNAWLYVAAFRPYYKIDMRDLRPLSH